MNSLTKHICYSELTNLEKVDYSKPIKILVVGTFNPAFYDNEAKWYYGREINEFWFLFPRMLGYPSLHAADVNEEREHYLICKEFCDKQQILVVDMIKQVHKELKGYTDNEINLLEINQVLPFDFETAFKINKPEKVIFTWKGNTGKVISVLKKKFKKYLDENRIPYCELPSGSPIYRKGRKAKLDEWVTIYNQLKINE